MAGQDKGSQRPFSGDFWKGEGGDKWVSNIELLEGHLKQHNDILLEHCAVREGETVLDVGCGGGLTSMALAERAGPTGRVLGVDVSPVILDIARERGRGIANLSFWLADAGSENLGEGLFDLITSRFGVMFFDQPVAAFGNLHTLLKPGGRQVILCWRRFEENPWMAVPAAAANGILPPEEEAAKPDPEAPGPFSLGDPERLRSVLESAGFTGVALEAVNTDIEMGSLDDAVYLTTQMGPASRALEGAAEDLRETAIAAIRQALQEYETDAGVVMTGACWIASAGK